MRIQYTASSSDVSINRPPCAEDETDDEPEELPSFKVRISVFFDGTGNNMFNTTRGLHGSSGGVGSFTNEYSNIAKLSNYITVENRERDYHFSVYVEGMGTLHDTVDDDVGGTGAGMGFGTGDRGIVNRVTNAIRRIFLEIRNLGQGTNRQITKLQIDSFGFSRGAASARHFIYRVFNSYQRSISLRSYLTHRNHGRFTIDKIKIKFVGLFDTVGSYRAYGIWGAFGSIEDDPQELHLNLNNLPVEIEKVTHIAAADEVRLNFPLTDITSAGAKGTTIFMPGVHSDIGGGYNNVSSSLNGRLERNLVVFRIECNAAHIFSDADIHRKVLDEKNRLSRLGYYLPDELTVVRDASNAYVIRANRRDINNTYARIPLKIMADEATQGGIVFDASLETDNTLHPFLNNVFNFINANRGQSVDFWTTTNTPAFLPELRHSYFHSSAHYTPTNIGAITVYPLKIQFYSPANNYDESELNAYFGVRKRRVLIDTLNNVEIREGEDEAARDRSSHHAL